MNQKRKRLTRFTIHCSMMVHLLNLRLKVIYTLIIIVILSLRQENLMRGINTLKQKAKLYAVADKEKINKIWDELSGNVDIFEYFYRLIILIRPKLEAGLSREQRLVNRYIRKQLSLLGKKEDEVYNPLFEALKKLEYL